MQASVAVKQLDRLPVESFTVLRMLCQCHKCGGSFLQDFLHHLASRKPFRDVRCDKCLCKRTHAWLEPDLFTELFAQGRIAPPAADLTGADLSLP